MAHARRLSIIEHRRHTGKDWSCDRTCTCARVRSTARRPSLECERMPDRGDTTSSRPTRELLVALAIYVVVAASFVAISRVPIIDTYVGQGEDRLEVLWNAWWMKRAILELRNPFFTDQLFHPFGTS